MTPKMKIPARSRNGRATSTPVTRFRRQGREDCEDRIAVEEPLEIRLGGKSVAVVMRSPGEDHELAAGFLFTEGILKGKDEVSRVGHRKDPKNPKLCNVINVTPTAGVDLSGRGWQRNFVSSSSCGLCGKLTIESVHLHAPAVDDDFRVSTQVLLGLPDQLRSGQEGFDETGGLHAAGLFDKEGRLLLLREDIGRHNAVDKIIGAALLNGFATASRARFDGERQDEFRDRSKGTHGAHSAGCRGFCSLKPRGGAGRKLGFRLGWISAWRVHERLRRLPPDRVLIHPRHDWPK